MGSYWLLVVDLLTTAHVVFHNPSDHTQQAHILLFFSSDVNVICMNHPHCFISQQ